MMTTSEAKPVDSNEELIRAVGGIDEDAPAGIDENISAGYLSDVEWKEEDPLIAINDENVTISQTPAAALTPIQALTENEMLSPLELPWERSLASASQLWCASQRQLLHYTWSLTTETQS